MASIEDLILRMLQAKSADVRPITIGDFARQFGANPQTVLQAARRLVDDRLARPSIIEIHGVQTLHGLLSMQPESQPSA